MRATILSISSVIFLSACGGGSSVSEIQNEMGVTDAQVTAKLNEYIQRDYAGYLAFNANEQSIPYDQVKSQKANFKGQVATLLNINTENTDYMVLTSILGDADLNIEFGEQTATINGTAGNFVVSEAKASGNFQNGTILFYDGVVLYQTNGELNIVGSYNDSANALTMTGPINVYEGKTKIGTANVQAIDSGNAVFYQTADAQLGYRTKFTTDISSTVDTLNLTGLDSYLFTYKQ